MNRKEQLEQLKSSFPWQEDSITHYHAAFLAHYHIMNTLVDEAAKSLDDNMPRLAYFLYTEYLYSFYSEMCLIIECLFKALMERNGYKLKDIKQKKHNITDLLDEVSNIEDNETKSICKVLLKHENLIKRLSSDHVFVRARYMEMDCMKLHDELDRIWGLLIDIDHIAYEFFAAGNLLNIVYPDSMVDGDTAD